ncbi:MAG: ABC transporter permease [Anaerolineae bacterium]|nr:ABC transporter permease [Anaerolineae bacterium]
MTTEAKNEAQDISEEGGVDLAAEIPVMGEAAERFAMAPQWQLMWWKFRRHRLALVSLVVIIILYTVAIFAGFFAPKSADPTELQTPSYTPPGYAHQTEYINAPPMPIHWIDNGTFAPYVYAFKKTRDPKTLVETFVATDTKIRLGFFVPGDRYTVGFSSVPVCPPEWSENAICKLIDPVLGFVKTLAFTADIHLFGPINPEDPFYPAGADDVGRDVFSRLIYASQVSLSVGLVGVFLSLLLGIFLGGLSGLVGGWVDNLIQRTIEVLRAIPDIPLWMALAIAMPPRLDPVYVYFGVTIILSLLRWTDLARVVRGKFLSLREDDFVTAAELDGVPRGRIIMRHMVPSFMSHIIAQMTLSIPGMILGESALSFLGVGLRPPVVSWGVMLNKAIDVVVVINKPWLLLPGLAIFVTILAFNFLGDGLRDAADPYHV